MKPINVINKLNESALTSVVNEYYSRLNKFLNQYGITFEVSPKSIYYYYNGNYLYSANLKKSVYDKGRIRNKIYHIQYSLKDDDALVINYIRKVYGDGVYKSLFTFKPEYNKKKNEMLKDIHKFVSSCKDLEREERQVLNDMDNKKEEREHNLIGDNAIVMKYNSKGDVAPHGANINEVKQHLSDIKYTCTKVGSTYYFKFNRKDKEEVKRRYNVLKDIADVSISINDEDE